MSDPTCTALLVIDEDWLRAQVGREYARLGVLKRRRCGQVSARLLVVLGRLEQVCEQVCEQIRLIHAVRASDALRNGRDQVVMHVRNRLHVILTLSETFTTAQEMQPAPKRSCHAAAVYLEEGELEDGEIVYVYNRACARVVSVCFLAEMAGSGRRCGRD